MEGTGGPKTWFLLFRQVMPVQIGMQSAKTCFIGAFPPKAIEKDGLTTLLLIM